MAAGVALPAGRPPPGGSRGGREVFDSGVDGVWTLLEDSDASRADSEGESRCATQWPIVECAGPATVIAALAFLVGVALVTAGVALVFPPAALVVAGVALMVGAVLWVRGGRADITP